MTYRFEIIGAPRTKGNSRQLVSPKGKPFFLPSAPYRRWFKAAMQQLPIIRMATRIAEPLRCPVRVSAVFYRDRDTGDLDNFKKGLGDYLQRARFIANDSQIASWDGSYLDVDRARPRIEVQIVTLGERPGKSALDRAKALLDECTREELRDHAFGDAEVYWRRGDAQVANGYFGVEATEVYLNGVTFVGNDAWTLRGCGTLGRVERNDAPGQRPVNR